MSCKRTYCPLQRGELPIKNCIATCSISWWKIYTFHSKMQSQAQIFQRNKQCYRHFSLTQWSLSHPVTLPAGQGKRRDFVTHRYGSSQLNMGLKMLHMYRDVCQAGRMGHELCSPARGGTRAGKALQDPRQEHST